MSEFKPAEYWENRLKDTWGLHGVGDIRLGKSFNAWLYKVRRHTVSREMQHLFLPPGSFDVMDIGSGTGFYINLWKDHGARSVTATDLTTVAVEHLRESFPDCECCTLDVSAPLEGDSTTRLYDSISAFDVLFHIVDETGYRRAFYNVAQMLKPDGYFLFTENLVHQEFGSAQHAVSRTYKDIMLAVHDAGFSVVTRVPMFVLMNFPVDTRSKLWKYLWLAATYPARLADCAGYCLGALLYPAELLLTSLLSEGPSTELVICRKREEAGEPPHNDPAIDDQKE